MKSARTVIGILVLVACLSSSAEAQHSRRMEAAPSQSAAPVRAHKAPAAVADGPVNINTADVTALMTLTGIRQKVAEKILAYREAHGPFKAAEEIRKVSGVGPGLWEKNRARIVVK